MSTTAAAAAAPENVKIGQGKRSKRARKLEANQKEVNADAPALEHDAAELAASSDSAGELGEPESQEKGLNKENKEDISQKDISQNTDIKQNKEDIKQNKDLNENKENLNENKDIKQNKEEDNCVTHNKDIVNRFDQSDRSTEELSENKNQQNLSRKNRKELKCEAEPCIKEPLPVVQPAEMARELPEEKNEESESGEEEHPQDQQLQQQQGGRGRRRPRRAARGGRAGRSPQRPLQQQHQQQQQQFLAPQQVPRQISEILSPQFEQEQLRNLSSQQLSQQSFPMARQNLQEAPQVLLPSELHLSMQTITVSRPAKGSLPVTAPVAKAIITPTLDQATRAGIPLEELDAAREEDLTEFNLSAQHTPDHMAVALELKFPAEFVEQLTKDDLACMNRAFLTTDRSFTVRPHLNSIYCTLVHKRFLEANLPLNLTTLTANELFRVAQIVNSAESIRYVMTSRGIVEQLQRWVASENHIDLGLCNFPHFEAIANFDGEAGHLDCCKTILPHFRNIPCPE